jgi:hypothetical protein
MASRTLVLKKKRKSRARKAGHERKAEMARKGTTPAMAVLFGDVKDEKAAK